MSISTVQGAINGRQRQVDFSKASPVMVAARPASYFYSAGFPAAAAAPTPGIGGEVLTSYAGQLPFTNPASGNSYLSRFQATAGVAGTLLICDRLWHNSGIDVTSTSEQVFTSSAQIPARDANGTNAGEEVFAAIEVSTVTGAGTPVATLKYTNSDGTPGQTAITAQPLVATSVAGTFYPFALAAGDKGIQKAESLTLNATWTSGTIHVVLFRVIARLEIPFNNTSNMIDAITGGFPRMYDNSVPFLVAIPSSTSMVIQGSYVVSQG